MALQLGDIVPDVTQDSQLGPINTEIRSCLRLTTQPNC
jgi:hypothetical protein